MFSILTAVARHWPMFSILAAVARHWPMLSILAAVARHWPMFSILAAVAGSGRKQCIPSGQSYCNLLMQICCATPIMLVEI